MSDRDPVCGQCHSPKLKLTVRKKGGRWHLRRTCENCGDPAFVIDADLYKGLEHIAPAVSQLSLVPVRPERNPYAPASGK